MWWTGYHTVSHSFLVGCLLAEFSFSHSSLLNGFVCLRMSLLFLSSNHSDAFTMT